MEMTNLFSTSINLSRRIHWVYWQCVFFMVLVFLAYERWIAGSNDLNPEQGLRGYIEVAIIAMAFLLAFLVWGYKPFINGFRLSTFTLLILFGCLAGLSALWSPNALLTLGKAGGLLLIILLASAVAYQAVQMEIPVARMVLTALILVTIFLFLVNLVEFQTFIRIDWSSNRPRLQLAFEHPNITAELFGSGILVGAYISMTTKLSQRWMLNLFAMAFMAANLVLTDSRGAYIATFLSLGLLLLSRVETKYWVVIMVALIAAVVNFLFILNLLGYLEPIVQNLITNNPEWLTLHGRLLLWDEIFNNSLTTNLVGAGYFSSRYFIFRNISWAFNSHNSFIEVFISIGVVGLMIVAAFYAACLALIRGWRAYPLPLVMLIYATIHGMVEVRLFIPGLLMFITCVFIFHQQFLQRSTSGTSFNPVITNPIA